MDNIFKPNELKKYYKKGKIMDLNLAIKKAIDLASEKKLPLLICGSIYSIAKYKKILQV